MKTKTIICLVITIFVAGISFSFADPATGEKAPTGAVGEQKAPGADDQQSSVTNSQKARLNSLFKAVKEKSKDIKPAKYEVTLPVSTAGARGAEVRHADRFAVIWPDARISPITALAENLRSAVEQGETRGVLKAQLDDFKKAFPEFNDHELMEKLDDIIKQAI